MKTGFLHLNKAAAHVLFFRAIIDQLIERSCAQISMVAMVGPVGLTFPKMNCQKKHIPFQVIQSDLFIP